ncbi:MAG TPA: hypothetical protein VKE69_11030 [Planctomycetota bacterium]|nr:hypothetical protein [Planctomycetota bacterium]
MLLPVVLVFTLFSPRQDGEGVSVERLLALARERAEQRRSLAAGAVQKLIADLDLPYEGNETRVDATVRELRDYGDAATPALVEALLDPPDRARGSNAARVLAASTDANVIRELEKVAASGPAAARARVAWILGRRSEPGAPAVLRTLLGEADESIAAPAASSLARLEVKDACGVATARLPGASTAALARALLSLIALDPEPAAAAAVAAFAQTPRAVDCPVQLGDAIRALRCRDCLAVAVKIAGDKQITPEDGAWLLRAVGDVVSSADRDVVTALKRMLDDSTSYEVKQEAAYALAAAKDPLGAHWLLKQPNDDLREQPDNSVLYRKRGRIYLRLKRYRDAAHDYDDVRRLSKRVPLDVATWVEAARAYAGNKSYGTAADALKQACGLGAHAKSFRELEEFADMRKQARWAPVFED